MGVKLSAGDPKGSLEKIKEVWKSMQPDRAFSFFFIDEDFDRQYQFEANWDSSSPRCQDLRH